ncbi:MAG: serine/threonine protein kinase, partial [Planctomycetes bacterium]|nr:serine/threonine protein kinase [Planctomycetota bacterium]
MPSMDDELCQRTLLREGVLSPALVAEACATRDALRALGIAVSLPQVLQQSGCAAPDPAAPFRDAPAAPAPPAAPTIVAEPEAAPTVAPAAAECAGPGRPLAPADPIAAGGARYLRLEELGRGGMGVVWKAWDHALGRLVALKQVLAAGELPPERRARFQREARLAARLSHPNIIRVLDVGIENGLPFFTCDYVAGRSLDRIAREPVPLAQALAWVQEVAEALAYAHAQGVVHRDVKPANLLIDARGRAHVMDFGLAKELAPDAWTASGEGGLALTASGSILGTPQYMSPEHAAGRTGEIGPASDQFSLGVVLYQLLTGRLPFPGATLRELLITIPTVDPIPPRGVNPAVPAAAEAICLRALEKEPARRYATLGELAADLGRARTGRPVRARPVSRVGRWARRLVALPGRVRLLLGAAAAGLLLVALSAGLAARTRDAAGPAARADGERFERAGTWIDARDAYRNALRADPEDGAAQAGFARTNARLREAAGR